MTALVIPDQTSILTTLGITAPKLADFNPGVPGKGLVDVWRRGVGITTTSTKVANWNGFNGTSAYQKDQQLKPDSTGAGPAFTYSGDYLITNLVPDPNAGYLVAKVKRNALSGATATFVAGEITKVSAPEGRLGLGFSSADKICAWLGASTPANFEGTTVVGVNNVAVIGLGWDASTGVGVLRLNGTQEASRAFTTNGATVGTRPIWFGALNSFNGINGEGSDTIVALAVYSGVLTDTDRAAIDLAMNNL